MTKLQTILLGTLCLFSLITTEMVGSGIQGGLWAFVLSIAAVAPFAWLLSGGTRTPSVGTLILVGANTFHVGHVLFDIGIMSLLPFGVMAAVTALYALARNLLIPVLMTTGGLVALLFADRVMTDALGQSTEAAHFFMGMIALSAIGLFMSGVAAAILYWGLSYVVGLFFPGARTQLDPFTAARVGYGAVSVAALVVGAIYLFGLDDSLHTLWFWQLRLTPLVALVVAEMVTRAPTCAAVRDS